ncbi:RNA polymerase-binding transcription factor DksA [Undibacterium sp. YM2]|nr:RNA polymerase-binding transcription factor DksA [Undibacterium sp. YM2]
MTTMQSNTASKKTAIKSRALGSKPRLTEEKILRMGEMEYMNDAQLAFFKSRLQEIESTLVQNANETTAHLQENDIIADPFDRATIEEEHALELRARDRESKLLRKVRAALVRIEEGDYGWCEDSGEPIGIERLLARPTATLSLEAQQRHEQRQKLFGH